MLVATYREAVGAVVSILRVKTRRIEVEVVCVISTIGRRWPVVPVGTRIIHIRRRVVAVTGERILQVMAKFVTYYP